MLYRKSVVPHPLSPKQLDEINEELITSDIVVPVLILQDQQQQQQQQQQLLVPTLLQSQQLLPPLTPEQQRPIQKVVFREDAKKPFKSKADHWEHALTYPITWCACSALYAVVLKHLLQLFPYPLRITTAVVGTQLLFSLTKWILVPKKSRPPSLSKLRQRHWHRLIPAALAHGLGTIASHYTVQAGPVTTCVLLKMLPYPLALSSIPMWLGAVVSVRRIFHLVIGLTANLCFAARHRIPISTRRFHGAQNVFEVTCALSLFIVVLPLTLILEGLPNILIPDGIIMMMMAKPTTTTMTTSRQVEYSYDICFLLLVLGILYSLGNEMGALLSTPKHADLVRRMVTWALAVVVMEEARSYQDVAGAMIVFGTQWLRNKYANNNNNSTRSLSTPEYNVVGNHKKQQNDLPVANRNRSFSADSYTTQGSLRTYNTLRSIPSIGS